MPTHWITPFLLLASFATAQSDASGPAQRGASEPAQLPPLPALVAELTRAPQSCWGHDGPADAPAPRFRGGDGGVLLQLGGARADAIELRPFGDLDAVARLRWPGPSDAADRPATLQLRRLRGSDVFAGAFVGATDGGTDGVAGGVASSACGVPDEARCGGLAAVADGALWLCLAGDRVPTLDDPRAAWRLDAVEAIGDPPNDLATTAGADAAQRGLLVRVGRRTAAVPGDLAAALRAALQQAHARHRDGWRLRLDSDTPALDDFVRDALANVSAQHWRGHGFAAIERAMDASAANDHAAAATSLRALGDSRMRTGPLAAWLRAGEWSAAAELLEQDAAAAIAAPADRQAACWLLLHHAWYLRTTHDAAPAQRDRALLTATATRIAEDAAAAPTPRAFVDELLAVHALGSMASVLDTIDRVERPAAWRPHAPAPRPGDAWQAQALRALQELEAVHWDAHAECFAPPLAATTQLLPCWNGWLLTTADKSLRNARTVLRACGASALAEAANGDAWPRVLVLTALTQFDGRERTTAIAPLLASATAAASFTRGGDLDAFATGAAVDAVLYARTGIRLLLGPGFDEDWLRWSPALPPNGKRAAILGLARDGWSADMWVDRASDGDTAALRCTLTLHGPTDAARLVVLEGGERQLQAELRAEESCTHTLPDAPRAALLGRR